MKVSFIAREVIRCELFILFLRNTVIRKGFVKRLKLVRKPAVTSQSEGMGLVQEAN